MPTQSVKWSIKTVWSAVPTGALPSLFFPSTTLLHKPGFRIISKSNCISLPDDKNNGESMSACRRQPEKLSQRCWQTDREHTHTQTEVNDWSAVWCDMNITSIWLFCAACLTRLCTILCLSSVFTSPSKSICSFLGVLTLLQDQSGHSYTDQNPDKIGWALQELAADGHTHTHTLSHTKKGTMRSHQSSLTINIKPTALGDGGERKALSVCRSSLSVQFISSIWLPPFSLFFFFFFLHHSLIFPSWLSPTLSVGWLAGVCAWMDVL